MAKDFIYLMESNLKYAAKKKLINEYIEKLDNFPFKILSTYHINVKIVKEFYNTYLSDNSQASQKQAAYIHMFASLSMTLENDCEI